MHKKIIENTYRPQNNYNYPTFFIITMSVESNVISWINFTPFIACGHEAVSLPQQNTIQLAMIYSLMIFVFYAATFNLRAL